jgi:hypothetical protein
MELEYLVKTFCNVKLLIIIRLVVGIRLVVRYRAVGDGVEVSLRHSVM